jgi:diguanylate cyclase (GGDEF)-like protein
VVARLGGEEFAIFAVDVQDESVPAFFENIRRQLEALSLRWKGKDLPIAASFGVCHGVRNSLQEMMSEADRMLYVAKSNGRNRVEIS